MSIRHVYLMFDWLVPPPLPSGIRVDALCDTFNDCFVCGLLPGVNLGF